LTYTRLVGVAFGAALILGACTAAATSAPTPGPEPTPQVILVNVPGPTITKIVVPSECITGLAEARAISQLLAAEFVAYSKLSAKAQAAYDWADLDARLGPLQDMRDRDEKICVDKGAGVTP